jgi:hypothetical protein
MAHATLKFLCRLNLALAIGVALGVTLWSVIMAWQGHSLATAMRGEVEDGLGLLEGLAALGGLCGTGTGLCWGLLRLGEGRDA